MSALVAGPTLLYAVDAFGQGVIRSATDTLGEPDPLLEVLACAPEQLAQELPAVLERLLRAGRAPTDLPGARLDVIAFASAEQTALLPACEAFAKVIADRFAVIFPADAPRSQRAVRLHFVVKVPPLATQAAGGALKRVADLEAWAQGQPAHPLLARIWLVARQTIAGVLSDHEVVSSCAAFALAMVASGVRTEEPVQARMAFPQGEGVVSLLAAACRDLPTHRLREYAAERAAYDGLVSLVSRSGQQANDLDEADRTVASLDAGSWLRPFVDGPPAQRCKKLTAGLSGVESRLPETRVGPLQQPERLREAFAELFAPATKGPRMATAIEGGEFEEVLKQLDQAETDVLVGFHTKLDALLEKYLHPGGGLKPLPALEVGLGRLRDRLNDEQARESGAALPPAREEDPGRTELEIAYRSLPRPAVVWASAAAAGLATGFAAIALVLRLQVAQGGGAGPAQTLSAPVVNAAASTTSTSMAAAPIDWALVAPWGIAAAVALACAVGWAWMVGRLTRKDFEAALVRRRAAIEALRERGGAGWGRLQGDLQLSLRKRRLRLGAGRAIARALEHLQAVRNQLIESRDRLRQQIVNRQVSIGAVPAQDDLTGLLGAAEPFQAPLLGSAPLARWVAQCRQTVEPEAWASRLLEGAWPKSGILEDVPCADAEQLLQLGRDETAGLRSRSLFDDESAIAAVRFSVQEVVARSPALAPICAPRNETDDPAQALRAGEWLVFAPPPARDTVEREARDSGLTLKLLPVPGTAPRVLILRTWEGFTAQSVIRGGTKRATSPGGS